ncbi:BspA family leucine-rich repeat surface protein [Leuconostoc falkenbergense]
MRVRKSLYVTITLLMTLSVPVQAVTASQLIDQPNLNINTNQHLPNEGRSDVQELIQRVDTEEKTPTSDETTPESDTVKQDETPTKATEEQPTDKNKESIQRSVVATGTNGGCDWSCDDTTKTVTIKKSESGNGKLATGRIADMSGFSSYQELVETITFDGPVIAPDNSTQLFDSSSAYLPIMSNIIGISNLDTSNVTNMTYMFQGVELSSLDLSTWNVDKVTTFYGMFQNAKMTMLNVSNFGEHRTATNVVMQAMFSSMQLLTDLQLTNFKTNGVVNMAGMFQANIGLEHIDLEDWDVSAVFATTQMFSGMTNLKTLNLSNWNLSQLTNCTYMVSNTPSLWRVDLSTQIKFPEDPIFVAAPAIGTSIVDNNKTYQTTAASWQAVGSGTVHNPKGATATTTQMWADTPRPVTYVWSHTNLVNGVHGTSPWTFNIDTGELVYKSGTFQNAQTVAANLESYNVNPLSVTSISFTGTVNLPANSASMFADMQNLISFNDTNINTSAVTDMSSMFNNTSELETLNLEHFVTTNVTDMRSMFARMTSVTMLNLSSFNTANVTNMSYMFLNLTHLTSINLSNFNTEKVTDMSGMFSATLPSDSGLQSLDLSNFNVGNVTTMYAMFDNAKTIKSINFSGFATNKVTDMRLMFDGCSGLEKLDLSDFDTTKLGWNVDNMFRGTTNLWSITLGTKGVFEHSPGFVSAPTAGTTIPGTGYVTSSANWQIVGAGTEFNPKGAFVTTSQMYGDTSRPVTYVWANTALPPALSSISSITFGSLGAHDFFNGNSSAATNMDTGSLSLINLSSTPTYNVTVAQTSDWTTDGESATIAKSDLKIKYGTSDLSTGACSFWSGTSATATKNIKFNHDGTKNFNIWLNPSTVLDTALLGKQLESELTWTLSETP